MRRISCETLALVLLSANTSPKHPHSPQREHTGKFSTESEIKRRLEGGENHGSHWKKGTTKINYGLYDDYLLLNGKESKTHHVSETLYS